MKDWMDSDDNVRRWLRNRCHFEELIEHRMGLIINNLQVTNDGI